MLILLRPSNCDCHCNSGVKLSGKVTVPEEKAVSNSASLGQAQRAFWMAVQKPYIWVRIQQETSACSGQILHYRKKDNRLRGEAHGGTIGSISVPYKNIRHSNSSGPQSLLCCHYCLTGILWALNPVYEHLFGQWASFCILRWKEKAYSL